MNLNNVLHFKNIETLLLAKTLFNCLVCTDGSCSLFFSFLFLKSNVYISKYWPHTFDTWTREQTQIDYPNCPFDTMLVQLVICIEHPTWSCAFFVGFESFLLSFVLLSNTYSCISSWSTVILLLNICQLVSHMHTGVLLVLFGEQ